MGGPSGRLVVAMYILLFGDHSVAVQHSCTVSFISSRQAQLVDTISHSMEVSWLSMMAKLSMMTALSSTVLAKSVSGGSPGKTSLGFFL